MQISLTAAKALFTDNDTTKDLKVSTTEKMVEDTTANLTAAIAKLIPKTQVNATALYEKIQLQTVTSPLNEDAYTAFTWQTYQSALSDGQSTLDGLFLLGEPNPLTNKAENQAAVDGKVTAITEAAANLCELKAMEKAAVYYKAISSLNSLLKDLKESDYNADTWSAFDAARTAAVDCVKAKPAPTTANTDPAYAEELTMLYQAFYKAYCFGLKSSEDSIGVTLKVADNLGAKYPQFALTDGKTAAFNGSVTLTGGNHTVQDLVTAQNLSFAADIHGAGLKQIYATWFIYLNGVLVADPIDGFTVFEKTIYDHGIVTYDPTIRDAAGNSTGCCNFNLRDGDEITLVRAEEPLVSYYGSGVSAKYSSYEDYIATLSLVKNGVNDVIEVKEGESFSLTVNKTTATLMAYNSTSRAATSVSLVYSDPADSAATVTGAVNNSGAVTDKKGAAAMALYQAGWYTVSTVDIRNQIRGSLDVYGAETGGTYPNLAAGDSVLVHVIALEGDALETALNGYLTKLDDLLAGYDQAFFGKTLWKQAQSAAYTAKAAIVTAESLATAQNALDTAKATLNDLETQAKTANATALNSVGWYFDRLPTAAQVEAGLFTKGDIERYQKLTELYAALSDYQKGNLTQAQIGAYQAMVTAYGIDGSALPEAKTYKLTVQCIPADNGSGITMRAITWPRPLQNVWDDDVYKTQTLETALTLDSITPGSHIAVDLPRTDGLSNGYEISKVLWDGADMTYEEYAPTTAAGKNMVFRILNNNMPRNDVTVTIHVRKTGELTFEEQQDAAKTALTEAYNGHNRAGYTAANWVKLVEAYNDGINAITAATATDGIETAKTTAINAMAAITKRDADDYGDVSVEFYNTTYADGLGYDDTAPFVKETITLAADDSLMSAALKALNKNGYTWSGTGGTGYDIGYLSTVYKDGKSLGEFDNGASSGWMGTLNDWFCSEGLGMFEVPATDFHQLKDGDTIKIMYTSEGYGNDLGGSWGNADTSLKALTLENAVLQREFDGATTSYMATLDDSFLDKLLGKKFSITPTAANKNYQVRIFLNDKTGANWYRSGEAIPAQAGDVIYIGVGERAWPSMNKQGAEAISYTGTWYTIYLSGEGDKAVQNAISLIDALPNAESVTTADKAAVNFANIYFKSLKAADQAKVTNSAKLTALLKQLAALDEIHDVINLIAALPGADAVTLDDAKAINAASAAYDDLTDSQKATMQLMYTEKLTAVKAALTALGYKDYSAYQTALTNVLSYIQTTVTNPTCGSTDGEWAALALARGNITNDDWYNLYLANLKAYVNDCDGVLHTKKYTEYSRVVLALTSLGVDASAFDTGDKVYDLVTPLLAKQTNGEYWATWQGNNGTCFALMALDSGNYLPNAGKEVRAALIDSLKANQLADGGWAINSSTSGFGVDVTAMVLQSLAPYYQDKAKFEVLGAKTTYNELKVMVNKAVDNMKNYTGNSYGSAEAAAQVVVALSTLGIDPDGAEWKAVTAILSYYDADVHGFRHVSDGTVNQMATEQAAYALVAYDRYIEEQNALYDMTDKFTAKPDVVYTDDQKAAMAVTEKIEALPETIALSDEEAITAARTAYDALTKEQKKLVDSITLTDLQNAEKALAQLKAAAADETAAKVVADQIAALPTDITLDSKTAVEAARAAYNGLTEAQKAYVTNLDKLTAAEAAVKALEEQQTGVDKMTDVEKGTWYYDDAAYCLTKGIMVGTGDTTFSPNAQVTRGQFVTFLGRHMGVKDATAEAPVPTIFGDVESNQYYASHVAWAVENGVVFGTSESSFEPNAFISRQDMAAMILRFSKAAGITLPDSSGTEAFADDGEIAGYAKDAVYSMKAAQIINGKGDNTFAPKDNATRAEAARILHILLEMK